jgi:phage pi2 protein 07
VADCATTWKANVKKMLKSSTSERIENDILATATATANSAVQNGGNAHYK